MRGLFYLMASITVGTLLYLLITEWQPIWRAGFKDFTSISGAIVHLDRTAKPVAEMMPVAVHELDSMRTTMADMHKEMSGMNRSIQEMTTSIARMDRSTTIMSHDLQLIPPQMNYMGGQVGQMRGKMTPMTMMPWNW